MFQGDQKQSVAEFMAFVHTSVNHMSHEYLLSERRYNYTTPKSFLEQVRLLSEPQWKGHLVAKPSPSVNIPYERQPDD